MSGGDRARKESTDLLELAREAFDEADSKKAHNYPTMERICARIKAATREALGDKEVPAGLHAASAMAMAFVSDDRSKMKEHVGEALSVVSVLGGAVAIFAGLLTIASPGIIGSLMALLFGGAAFPMTAPIAVAVGVALVATAVILFVKRSTPKDRFEAGRCGIMKALHDLEEKVHQHQKTTREALEKQLEEERQQRDERFQRALERLSQAEVETIGA